jgi:hypothetical protein
LRTTTKTVKPEIFISALAKENWSAGYVSA